MSSTAAPRNWRDSLQNLAHPAVVKMLFLGFSAGIPFMLIFSSLSLWLSEAGIEKSTVTYFSWAGLAYSFKFIWSPIIDRIPVPWLTNWLGRRRGWLLTAQVMIIIALFLMGSMDPTASDNALLMLAFSTILLGFSAASQDIVIDAYRIESAINSMQALLSSTYIAGYRFGMLLSGAGALFLAEYLGSSKTSYSLEAWQLTYYAMAACMLIGIVTTLLINEPTVKRTAQKDFTRRQYARFFILFLFSVSVFVGTFIWMGDLLTPLKTVFSDWLANDILAGSLLELIRLVAALTVVIGFGLLLNQLSLVETQLVKDNYVEPVADFFRRYGTQLALLLLLFIGFYRVSDIVLGVIANVFYHDIGFSKSEIATVSKTYGLIMMIIGGFVGGILSIRFGVLRILYLGATMTVLTNLSFMILAEVGNDIRLLYLVISADNFTSGLASAVFIAFLASITNVSFTAVQYSIFSSLMSLIPKIIGGYSGSMVNALGYTQFFFVASMMGLPVLLMIYGLSQRLDIDNDEVN